MLGKVGVRSSRLPGAITLARLPDSSLLYLLFDTTERRKKKTAFYSYRRVFQFDSMSRARSPKLPGFAAPLENTITLIPLARLMISVAVYPATAPPCSKAT